MSEKWKNFAGGNYAVSDQGRVKRLTPGSRTRPGRLLKPGLMKIGYYCVKPVVGGSNVLMYVHRLVAEHFIGPRPEGLELNHKDGVKTNNRVDNLEYVSHSENMRHARRLGLIHDRRTIPDETVTTVREIRKAGHTYRVIHEVTGVSPRYCRDIVNLRARKGIQS